MYIVYCIFLKGNDEFDTLSRVPRPIEIVKALPDHKFELNIEALEEILWDDEVRDKPVVVLSVAGAFRKGKSFLLDYFLRYLNFKVFKIGRTIECLLYNRNPIVQMMIVCG